MHIKSMLFFVTFMQLIDIAAGQGRVTFSTDLPEEEKTALSDADRNLLASLNYYKIMLEKGEPIDPADIDLLNRVTLFTQSNDLRIVCRQAINFLRAHCNQNSSQCASPASVKRRSVLVPPHSNL